MWEWQPHVARPSDFSREDANLEFYTNLQIFKYYFKLTKEESLSQTKHRPVGRTRSVGCQCVVPELFGTRGTESHTALALFHFSLSRV